MPALAATTDPLAVIGNLNTFIFSVIRAIGLILLGWGIVQICRCKAMTLVSAARAFSRWRAALLSRLQRRFST